MKAVNNTSQCVFIKFQSAAGSYKINNSCNKYEQNLQIDKYHGLQIGKNGGTDERLSPFFVADNLKVALEEPCSAFFSQLTAHVYCEAWVSDHNCQPC